MAAHGYSAIPEGGKWKSVVPNPDDSMASGKMEEHEGQCSYSLSMQGRSTECAADGMVHLPVICQRYLDNLLDLILVAKRP